MSVYENLDVGLQEYCMHLKSDYESNGYNKREFYCETGRKYIHIIMQDVSNVGFNQRSSHSWVMIKDDKKFKQGDILKSAGWKAPTRNFKRGNVLTGDFKSIRWCGI